MITIIISAPALVCGVPVFIDVYVMVTWIYKHTGGLTLTNVSVSYKENNSSMDSMDAILTEIDATSVKVYNLKLGSEYVFNISAQNNYGSTSIICGPSLYVTG